MEVLQPFSGLMRPRVVALHACGKMQDGKARLLLSRVAKVCSHEAEASVLLCNPVRVGVLGCTLAFMGNEPNPLCCSGLTHAV